MKGYDLFLGDCRVVLNDARGFDLVFTSPPYNIGSRCPTMTGGRRKGGYDAKSWGAIRDYPDSMDEREYQKSQKEILRWCAERLSLNGVIVYNHKVRHRLGACIKPERWILPLEDEGVLVLRDEVVWDRGSTHNHTKTYVYQHTERLYVLCRPGAVPYFRNQPIERSSGWKGMSDVWRIPPEGKSAHNAPFPMSLVRQAIRMWCPPNGLVCDPYSGSGTTMVAAYLEGRRFVGSEILEKYYRMGVDRLSMTEVENVS